MAGFVWWHRGTGGIGTFLLDVIVLGLVLFAPLAMLALALTNWVVGFLGGLIVILLGDLFQWVSRQRNAEAAKAGDATAQARIDRWKKWQKKWAR